MRATTSPTGETVGFDGLQAVVGAGEGVVGRFPGIVCVAQCPDPGPLREFLAVCASVAGPDPGRALARRLATWMSGSGAPGPELRFGTVAAAGEQLAVFLVGAVEARVDGLGGLTLSGAHAAIGTDRLLTRPRTPLVLSMDGGQVRADPADVFDLQAGVVPGSGVVLHPASFDRDEPDAGGEAALAGHEWFDTADLASDPLGEASWAAGVPEQRTAGRNGSTHRPGMAEDVEWGAAPGPDLDREHRAGTEAVSHPEFAAEPSSVGDESLNGSHEGRHALLSPGDPADDDALSTSHEDVVGDVRGRDVVDSRDVDVPFETFFADRSTDSRAPDLRALDPRTGDPPGDAVADQDTDWMTGAPTAAERAIADRSSTDTSAERSSADDGTAVGGPADSYFAPAPSDSAPSDAAPYGDAADTAAATARPGATAHPGAVDTGAPSTGQAASGPPAPAPVVDEQAVDLFATPPRAEAQPASRTQADPRVGRPPTPRPVARRVPSDVHPDPRESDGRGTDQPEPAPRARDGRPPSPGGTPGARGPSAAEATSTMPDLFHSTGDPDAADPLPVTSVPDVRQAPYVVDPARASARIRGYRCENGHLNDPRSPTCRQCGATIDERAGGLVAGARPPLGRLVFDDGAAHVVDGGYLVGRMPEVDDRVRTGELRPIVVEDRAGSVSRVHAEIRVSGWDVIVVDTGSRNGTFVSGPNEGTWTALPPRRSRRLLPGARVRMGARVFMFESSSTVR